MAVKQFRVSKRLVSLVVILTILTILNSAWNARLLQPQHHPKIIIKNVASLERKENLYLEEIPKSKLLIEENSDFSRKVKVNLDESRSLSRYPQSIKKILFWHPKLAKRLRLGLGNEPFLMAGCPESRCYLTASRQLLAEDEFDAILFNGRELDGTDVPSERSRSQRYILYEKEVGSYKKEHILDNFNDFFNWTFSFRQDSDIWARYGSIVSIGLDSSSEVSLHRIEPNYARGKTGLAVWFSSNCKTASQREYFVKKLKEQVEIDFYGGCGSNKCPKTRTKKCYSEFEKKYKFYLAFENALCVDYVTQRFYNIMRYNIVPIVYGLGNYANIAPPHSYIDVSDFKTPEELGNYLLYLDKNDTAYNEYFSWKKKYISREPWFTSAQGFCNLCKKLHTDTQTSIYPNVKKWLGIKKSCEEPSTLWDVTY